MAALDQALDVWADVDLSALREKSLDLADYFINLIDRKCAGHDLTLITPRERQQRGSQVSFTHPDGGYAMMNALIAAGVIGDFRNPDILRFGQSAECRDCENRQSPRRQSMRSSSHNRHRGG